MNIITSTANVHYKQLLKHKYILVEGVRAVFDAIKNGAVVKQVVIKGEANYPQLENFSLTRLDERLFAKLAQTENAQDVLILCELPKSNIDITHGVWLMCDGLQDPGNVGTIIRTAHAFALDGVILCECVNVANPKLVRASMGSLFCVNVAQVQRTEFMQLCKTPIFVADVRGTEISCFTFAKNCVIVIGNEAVGVSDVIKKAASLTFTIPMRGTTESLNAAIAAGIVCYEVSKL